ncbi:pyridoxamine 5'-phosphate oxidase family protein [Breoghania sp.]|uniref:pyridoxamine 5'-phosphate oxidase family protein n=1 Tax=Breoghania sp. TaxID=2065378 RepID=UPI002615BCF9|nr:pyridoxamine 5'-phosphate oxidase family protein [Breoghania sp.]MDJ0930497.1 pyridoxamine 5'-phosphate oxidase family protein [Breoghania sp.]
MTAHTITTLQELEALYGQPAKRSLIKELDHISDHYRAFIDAAPFVVIASVGEEGLDCSPRGDPAGFVRVVDPKTVLIPDRRGNNRIDTLRNIVRDPHVSLLFLIPGVGETLRINGQAEISADPELCASFAVNGKEPATVLKITAERAYFQCQKALVRSRLWAQETQIERSALPSTGTIIKALDEEFDAKSYDDGYTEHLARTIY